jgi:hypothetical protein
LQNSARASYLMSARVVVMASCRDHWDALREE